MGTVSGSLTAARTHRMVAIEKRKILGGVFGRGESWLAGDTGPFQGLDSAPLKRFLGERYGWENRGS